jgi:regulator of sigma D
MLDQCTIEERWTGVDKLIERWLAERQALLVQFCALSDLHEESPATTQVHQKLQNFCQILVDYVSAGHFEVYYELLREAEAFDDGSAELAKSLLPSLSANTQTALEFNDQYGNVEAGKVLKCLTQNLSTLGEVLESRFELEDRLTEVMHKAHRKQLEVPA